MFGKLRRLSHVSYCHLSPYHSVVTENDQVVTLDAVDFHNSNKVLQVPSETFTPSNIINNPSLMVNAPSFGVHSMEDLQERVEQMAAAPDEEIKNYINSQSSN